MLKRRRFVQVTARARGMREIVGNREGVGLVVSGEPDSAAKVAKRVVGIAKVAKSFAVKR